MFPSCVDTTTNVNGECENVSFFASLCNMFFRTMPTFLARESSARERTTRARLQWEGVWISFVSFYNLSRKSWQLPGCNESVINLADDNSRKTCAVCKAGETAFPPRINHADLRFAFFVVRACVFLCFICLWEVSVHVFAIQGLQVCKNRERWWQTRCNVLIYSTSLESVLSRQTQLDAPCGG